MRDTALVPPLTSFPIVEHRLDNGLRVVVSEDHVAPVATVNLWYDVGSRHEPVGKTGLAHLFEHLMFEGSRQVASGEHFQLVSAAGGTLNATTSSERTNYFETVPAEQLDLALWLEADRMGGLLDALSQESLDNQRGVVKNERRQRCDNVPYGTSSERLNAALFPPGHPYHHTTIGSMADLDAASLADLEAFFRTYYVPNNCILTIAGDVPAAAAIAAVERWFGGIPAGPPPPPPPDGRLGEPLAGEVRLEVEEPVPAEAVYLAWRLPAEDDPALEYLSVAATILAVGRASLFERHLVRAELAQRAAFVIDPRIGGASIGVAIAHARPGVPVGKVEDAIRVELQRLADDGPTPAELHRAKAMIERTWLDRVGEIDGRADELSRATQTHGDPNRVNTAIDIALAATAADVCGALRDHVADQPAVALTYHPTRECA